MDIPDKDVQAAERLGKGFYIARQEGRGKPWQTVSSVITSPAEAIRLAKEIDAWHVAVYTSGMGYQYWSSKEPDTVNSGALSAEDAPGWEWEEIRLPYFEMSWEVYFRTIRKEKAEKYLQRLIRSLGEEIFSSACERWHRDRTLFRIDFTTRIATESIQEAVFQALRMGQRVQHYWQVTGPTSYEGDRWEFRGHSQDETIGVVSLNFNMINYALQKKELEKLDDSTPSFPHSPAPPAPR